MYHATIYQSCLFKSCTIFGHAYFQILDFFTISSRFSRQKLTSIETNSEPAVYCVKTKLRMLLKTSLRQYLSARDSSASVSIYGVTRSQFSYSISVWLFSERNRGLFILKTSDFVEGRTKLNRNKQSAGKEKRKKVFKLTE